MECGQPGKAQCGNLKDRLREGGGFQLDRYKGVCWEPWEISLGKVGGQQAVWSAGSSHLGNEGILRGSDQGEYPIQAQLRKLICS